MTVALKLKKTLATVKSVKASLELFSVQTKDEKVQKLFSDSSMQLETTVDALEQRLKQMEEEEPQYKQ